MKTANLYHLLPSSWQGVNPKNFANHYQRVFSNARELYVLSAFLTAWPSSLALSEKCSTFRLIIGTDFGTTRRAAAQAALDWLPEKFANCLLAFNQARVSFHPKIILWRNHQGERYFTVGSSNLTKAAFEKNVEANVTLKLNAEEFEQVRSWIQQIEEQSVPVTPAWLAKYQEAPPRGRGGKGENQPTDNTEAPVFNLSLELHDPAERSDFMRYLDDRRQQRRDFDLESKAQLEKLFRKAAAKPGKWTERENISFFDDLWRLWAQSHKTRLGGNTWVILGKHANHRELARSLVKIIDATPTERDQVVVQERDRLREARIATRAAPLTELLCHFFPKAYPILDAPVRRWRTAVGFDHRVGGTEGQRYLRLAQTMRAARRDHGPTSLGIRDLAELDTLIWYLYGRNAN